MTTKRTKKLDVCSEKKAFIEAKINNKDKQSFFKCKREKESIDKHKNKKTKEVLGEK